MPDDWTPIIRLVSDGGMIGLLVAILIGGVRQWWVFGWTYRDKARESEEWKVLALQGVTTAEANALLAETIVRRRIRRSS